MYIYNDEHVYNQYQRIFITTQFAFLSKQTNGYYAFMLEKRIIDSVCQPSLQFFFLCYFQLSSWNYGISVSFFVLSGIPRPFPQYPDCAGYYREVTNHSLCMHQGDSVCKRKMRNIDPCFERSWQKRTAPTNAARLLQTKCVSIFS